MPGILDRPLIQPKFYSNANNRPSYHCRGLNLRLSYFSCPSRVSVPNLPTNFVRNSYRQCRVSKDFLSSANLWNQWRGERILVRANRSCEQDTGSTGSSPEPNDSRKPDSSQSRREKEKGRWWSQWQWQPLIQGQEIAMLLLQLGIAMFVMRLLRPGIPLPGSDPRPSTAFVSVPYSEFMNRVNDDQVQKVEVDGVNIMFKLRNEGDAECETGSSLSDHQNSESILRSVAPSKRVVYTTIRPADMKAPYEKMLENHVEFGSPDKRSRSILHSGLVSWFVLDSVQLC